MTPDTELTEVAGMLPPEAAAALLDHSTDIQQATLRTVRACCVYWEGEGILLNPVQFAAILNSLVAISASMGQRLEMQENVIAGQQLMIYEALLKEGTQ